MEAWTKVISVGDDLAPILSNGITMMKFLDSKETKACPQDVGGTDGNMLAFSMSKFPK